jgi:hypothetical protein
LLKRKLAFPAGLGQGNARRRNGGRTTTRAGRGHFARCIVEDFSRRPAHWRP